tara:strand:- start:2282 stop:3049 length:768 start_codon:yes stop_codon:yes gene_type:complete
MDTLFPHLDTPLILMALAIALCAGVVKGIVGFAMPLVLISGLTTFLSPEIALAGLILPTVVTNGFQALRQGPRAAWKSIKLFKVFLIAGGIALICTAQLVRVVPGDILQLLIGVPVVLFAVLQLSGYQFNIKRRSLVVESGVGAFAGGIGGISGVWGPPTVAYLTALDTPKHDQMRIQGVIYGLGALALLGAHIGSGVLRADTAPFSAILVIPAVAGMWLGGKIMDRIDQRAFRRATLFVLLIAGANLIRRALLT